MKPKELTEEKLEEVDIWAHDVIGWWLGEYEGVESNMAEVAAALAFLRSHPEIDTYLDIHNGDKNV
jgi:hypothetical protein